VKKLLLFLLLSLLSFNSYAGALCNDGWISKSSGSGTCSWHGGVKKWLNKKKSPDNNDDDWDGSPPCDGRPTYSKGINGMNFMTKDQCLERRNKRAQAFFQRLEKERIERNEKNNSFIYFNFD